MSDETGNGAKGERFLNTDLPAEAIEQIKAKGGWCHRRLWITQQIGQVPPQIIGGAPGLAVQASVGAGTCVGRLGICGLWDADLKQCLDVTVARAQIIGAAYQSGMPQHKFIEELGNPRIEELEEGAE